jgi:23S rRNA (cytidine1920-2'-O)/16S rRNA (cytidine1409-2'-O)-methyltransferase
MRVVVMERTNARHARPLCRRPVSLITIDASFISLRILLAGGKNCLAPQGGQVVTLIKPQFEAGGKESARGEA